MQGPQFFQMKVDLAGWPYKRSILLIECPFCTSKNWPYNGKDITSMSMDSTSRMYCTVKPGCSDFKSWIFFKNISYKILLFLKLASCGRPHKRQRHHHYNRTTVCNAIQYQRARIYEHTATAKHYFMQRDLCWFSEPPPRHFLSKAWE